MKLFSNLYDRDTSTSQTDGRTDRQTTCRGSTALSVASRGNKIWGVPFGAHRLTVVVATQFLEYSVNLCTRLFLKPSYSVLLNSVSKWFTQFYFYQVKNY